MTGFDSKRAAAADKLQEPSITRPCRSCGGTGDQDTGIPESPIATCKPCNGTGQIALAQPAQEPINLLEARKIAAEYGIPNSQIDSGNLYFALMKCLEHIDAQPVQEPVAQWLEDAFREGWEAYRESEFASKITEDWAFGNSFANCRMIDLQQNTPPLPVQPAQEPEMLTIAYQSGYHDGKKAALAGREWNFCERCGKRTADKAVIHTCTPPQEGA
jgi:hypothetical protein